MIMTRLSLLLLLVMMLGCGASAQPLTSCPGVIAIAPPGTNGLLTPVCVPVPLPTANPPLKWVVCSSLPAGTLVLESADRAQCVALAFAGAGTSATPDGLLSLSSIGLYFPPATLSSPPPNK